MRLTAVRAVVLILGAPVAAAFGWTGQASGELTAGAAKSEFRLPPGVPLAGYSRRSGGPSTGTHDPVGARALVLHDGTNTAILVSSDLLIIDEQLSAAVRARLNDGPVPRDAVLMLAATHTHSGPGAYGSKFFEKLSMGHYDEAVFSELVERIAQTVDDAFTARVPVKMRAGSVTVDGAVENRMQQDGPVDDEATFVVIDAVQADRPLAVIIGFAAHPTTLGADNRKLSSDYPGVVVRQIEHAFPQAVALFFAGAVGDQAPVKSGEGFAATQHLGEKIVGAVLPVARRGQGVPDGKLYARQETFDLPPALVKLGKIKLPRWFGGRFVDDDATVSVVSVGPFVWIGVPCDMGTELGVRLKAAAGEAGLQPMLVGFANDYIGYCMPEHAYDEDEYEVSMAFNGPKAGEQVVEHAFGLLVGAGAKDDE